jgi:branched-chain amino acid transport system permease protein
MTRRRLQPVAAVGAAVLAVFVVPAVLNDYWLFIVTSGLIAVLLMQSLGIVVGRLGVLVLCGLSFAGIGAWTTQWLAVHEVPGGFLVWGLAGALAAVPLGLLIGLMALRLRGPTLAVATFAIATTTDAVWSASQFPGEREGVMVLRPEPFAGDTAYFVLVVGIVTVLFGLLAWVDRTRLGAAWQEVRFSERAAGAHGINVALAKVSAFALAAFLGGLAGALMSAQQGLMTGASFTSLQSVTLIALVVMLGVHHWDGALGGGLLFLAFPALLAEVDIPADYAVIAFGVLALFVLRSGKGLAGQSDMIRMHGRRRRAAAAMPPDVERPPATEVRRDGVPALSVRGVGVTFGAVRAVDDMDLDVPAGSVVALIGPNGAGKSTFVNAVSGFLPAAAEQISVHGRDVRGLAAHRRARAGLRRSFQHAQVAAGLTVGMYVRSAAGRRLSDEEVDAHLAWFACPPADVHVSALDMATRRLLEVAGLAASHAAVVVLDEPAAGQSAAGSQRLGAAIADIPRRSGSAVLLIEHDMDLVRATCDEVVVMDAGRLLARGTPSEVLSAPAVVRAYLGSVEEPAGEAVTVAVRQVSEEEETDA